MTWADPRYPGIIVRRADFERLDSERLHFEAGFVGIQHYAIGIYRVVAFLPGFYSEHPGDSPKLNADWDHLVRDRSRRGPVVR